MQCVIFGPILGWEFSYVYYNGRTEKKDTYSKESKYKASISHACGLHLGR